MIPDTTALEANVPQSATEKDLRKVIICNLKFLNLFRIGFQKNEKIHFHNQIISSCSLRHQPN